MRKMRDSSRQGEDPLVQQHSKTLPASTIKTPSLGCELPFCRASSELLVCDRVTVCKSYPKVNLGRKRTTSQSSASHILVSLRAGSP